MVKAEHTEQQKRLDSDLLLILGITLFVLGIFMTFNRQIVSVFTDPSLPVLIRVGFAAVFQFGLSGLGITFVTLLRKESFLSHGLQEKGLLVSVLLCIACFAPYGFFLVLTHQVTSYLPFQSVITTQEILASNFPINFIGMLITATAWGFFEGFNYVVISDKINKRYPSSNKFLNWGAISCAVICILIHGAVGVTLEGVIEMVTILLIIYGMLLVKEKTGNAWGCVVLFILFWNAF